MNTNIKLPFNYVQQTFKLLATQIANFRMFSVRFISGNEVWILRPFGALVDSFQRPFALILPPNNTHI